MKQFWLLLGLFALGSGVVGCTTPEFAPPATDMSETISEPTAVADANAALLSTAEPVATATEIPTQEPTLEPTEAPRTAEPTAEPTEIPTEEAPAEPVGSMLPGTELFTFIDDEPVWYTVDDNVMGGVSNSSVEVREPNVLYFSGKMSLDNNGGFSSVRSDWTPTDLTGNDGVLLRVLGDGKIYRLRIRTAAAGAGISYNALFETQADTWTVVYIPFADMIPTYRGFVMDVGALDAASIGSFGFMLSDKQPGQFELQVDWVRAVSEEELQAINS